MIQIQTVGSENMVKERDLTGNVSNCYYGKINEKPADFKEYNIIFPSSQVPEDTLDILLY